MPSNSRSGDAEFDWTEIPDKVQLIIKDMRKFEDIDNRELGVPYDFVIDLLLIGVKRCPSIAKCSDRHVKSYSSTIQLALRTVMEHKKDYSLRWKYAETLLSCLSMWASRSEISSPDIHCILSGIEAILANIFANNSVSEEFFSVAFIHGFGFIISTFLAIMKSESRDLSLRYLAAKILMRIVNAKSDSTLSISTILPGVCSKLAKLATDSMNFKLGQDALKIYSLIITTACSSAEYIRLLASKGKASDLNEVGGTMMCVPPDSNSNASKLWSLLAKKDVQWYDITTTKVTEMCEQLVAKLSNSNSHLVRLSLLQCIDSIRTKCEETFAGKLDVVLINICIALLTDSYSGIAQESQLIIERFRQNSERIFTNNLKEQLGSLSDTLLRAHVNKNDPNPNIRRLSSIIRLLGNEHFDGFIRACGRSLLHFLSALSNVIKVDVQRLRIIRNVYSNESDNLGFIEELPLVDGVQIGNVSNICKCISLCPHRYIALDQLRCDPSQCNVSQSTGCLIIIILIYRSLTVENAEIDVYTHEICCSLIEYCVQSLEIITTEELVKDDIVEDVRHAVNEETCFAAVLLSAIGVLFQSLRSVCEHVELVSSSLFQLFKWSKSSSSICVDCAENSLMRISKVAGNVDVSTLCLSHNCYLIPKIAVSVRNYRSNMRAPYALAGLLDKCDHHELFGGVRHLFDELFFALDNYSQEHIIHILYAFLSFSRALGRWFLKDKCERIDGMNDISDPSPFYDDSVPVDGKLLNSRHGVLSPDDKDPTKEAPPLYIVSSTNMLKRTKQLLSSPLLPIRITALDIVKQCLINIRDYESELLPMIHQNWQGIRSCFSCDVTVRISALEVISTMCDLSASFVYRRFKADVWPLIYSYMIDQSRHSRNASSGYRHLSAYIYQRKVLQCLADIWLSLKPESKDWKSVKEVIDVYLNDSQPRELYDLAHKNKYLE